MKKRITLYLAALALCLTACQPQPAEPSATPTPPETALPVAEVTPTPVPTPTPEPTPAIDLSTLEPWQEAYLDILLHPEEYEEFYAVADEHDGSLWVYEWDTTVEEEDSYCFFLCDLDGDGIPELMLGIKRWFSYPWIILNILRWNEETETVEDMDGPKTYGILSTLWFFENGYLGTASATGRLYARYWALNKDSNDYWYGYLRGGTEIYDSDDTPINGSEFYAMLGERMDSPDWQELTEETVRQAFLSTAREEAAP